MLSESFEDIFTGSVSPLCYILSSVKLLLISFMPHPLMSLLFIVNDGDIFPIISYHCQHSSPGLLGERGWNAVIFVPWSGSSTSTIHALKGETSLRQRSSTHSIMAQVTAKAGRRGWAYLFSGVKCSSHDRLRQHHQPRTDPSLPHPTTEIRSGYHPKCHSQRDSYHLEAGSKRIPQPEPRHTSSANKRSPALRTLLEPSPNQSKGTSQCHSRTKVRDGDMGVERPQCQSQHELPCHIRWSCADTDNNNDSNISQWQW